MLISKVVTLKNLLQFASSFIILSGLKFVLSDDYYITPFRVFHTSVSRWFLTGVGVVGWLLLEFEWQQVPLNLQDSPQYSGWSW